MTENLKQFQNDDQVQVLIIRGEGKHFCAGADLTWMKKMGGASLAENKSDARALAEMLHLLDNFSKPVITLVQGAAFGGALGLMACSDIVIATDAAQFCFSEIKLNLLPAIISPYVIRAIGERQARRYFLTGEKFTVEQALRMNLVHHIDNADNLTQAAQPFIHALLSHNPKILLEGKRLIQSVVGAIPKNMTDKTIDLIAHLRCSADAQIALEKFLK